jgi:hypothetical protein
MEHHDDDDHSEVREEEEDQLPFAVGAQEETLRIQSTPQHAKELAAGCCTASADTVSSSFHSAQVVPDLASSVISSSQTTPSNSSCVGADSSFLVTDSQYLDAAASLLLPTASLFANSSVLLPSQQSRVWTNTASEHGAQSSVRPVEQAASSSGFSLLLEQADNRQQPQQQQQSESNNSDAAAAAQTTTFARKPVRVPSKSPAATTKQTVRLPVLPEEDQSVTSTTAGSLILEGFETIESSGGYPLSSPENNCNTPGNPTWFRTAGAASSSFHYKSEERRLAALAGATAVTTGDNAFTVTVDLNHCSVADVMDVVGNPDLLRLWCDPVEKSSLVIVSSSEGARNATERLSTDPNREYEGEWIEATSPGLVAPPGCMVEWTSGLATMFGFPVYGKITMFVERLSGQVGLTLGPFPGNTQVCHKIKVFQLDNGKLRIEDAVRLRKCDEDGENMSFCGIMDVLQRCFMPSVEDYMDQVLSSMARLRFLIENGETAAVSPEASVANAQADPHSPLLVNA